MSRRRRTKLPIPSFKPPPPEAKLVSVSTNDETKMREKAKTKIRLPLNEYCLIKLETALQLYLHHQQQNGDRVSFADFFTIASKIDKNVTSSKDNKTDDDNKGDDSDSLGLWKLSTEERLWHDIYCVAVPAMYRIGDPINNEKNTNHKNNNGRKAAAAALVMTRVSFPAATIVEKVAGEGNRLKELRRLIREVKIQGIDKAKSARAFDLLLALRRERTKYDQERRKGKNLAKELGESSSVDFKCNGNKNIFSEKKKQSRIDLLLQDPGSTNMNVVKDGSTIEDRVRARAQERDKNLQLAQAARKDPREERVPIADALFSYASHILRRTRCRRKQHISKTKSSNSGREPIRGLSLSSRFAKSAGGNDKMVNISTSPSICIVTFEEVVKNALPNRSRKEIARLMFDIVQVLSLPSSNDRSRGSTHKFLKWRDPKSGEINGLPISNDAIVRIETINFKYIRAVLNRKKVTDENGGEQQSKRIRESAASKSNTSSSVFLATSTGEKQGTKANNSDTVGKKRPVPDPHSNDKQRRVHSHTKSKRKSR